MPARPGLSWGFLGVLAFSFTVPLTRLAVGSGHLSSLLVGSARAVVAALLAGLALWFSQSPRPRGREWIGVGVVAAGAVLGFPLLTSIALTQTPASHGAVVIALLPATTAIVSVVRTGERPGRVFWVASAVGAVAAVLFAAVQRNTVGQLQAADVLLFAAVIVCALAYAEGGILSRRLGAWQTISWALLAAAPVTILLTGWAVVDQPPTGTPAEWLAFAYLGVVSMFLGFVAWYRGLAIGPLAQVSQIQLAQPVMSIGWAALILHESITWPTLLGGVAVIACALVAVRSRTRPSSTSRGHAHSDDRVGR
ncbi:DMT family transporter [Pseudonocardia sp. ICBG1142]|uniref:DMT family transporter n=1 Tax=Pseudonocardia sp. ICBG1142 TaxID=2846760 RepID=UPI001CF70D37|nr:DMT family transporter [Pseudonocardia sp. ICBG1142]